MAGLRINRRTDRSGQVGGSAWVILGIAIFITIVAPLWLSAVVGAAVQNPTATAKVSFTFDDGLASTYTQARPTLARHGLTGTTYVSTRCIGMTTTPNTCHANTDTPYMSWAQVKQLQALGWEIGSHTLTHPYLASSDASDGQPDVLTPAQIDQELAESKAELAAQGIDAKAFASPYGDYSNATLAQIAKYYTSHRGFADQADNNWPYNDYLLNNMQVQAGVTVAQVKAKINAAIAEKKWLILTLHDVKRSPSSNPDDYEYSRANLNSIAAYVKNKQDAGLITAVNISEGLVASDANLLPNSGFDSGIASGWTTDAPTEVTANAAGNGSFPGSTQSVSLTASAANTHLFSPTVAVTSNTTYLVKNYLNVSRLTGGEVGFYIDEYDNDGSWLSGQYKNGERSVFVERYNFTYTPTSAAVTKARLQVIVTGNSDIQAYYDNAEWFALSATTPPPVVTPTNLVANGAFDNGISDGWTTDAAGSITKDATSQGSPANPVNSIRMQSTNSNAHLFSPKATVDATKNYTILGYVAVQQLSSGEVGFYIDEYDANGNWVSGQYKTGVRGTSAGDVNLSYQPSSSSVKTASLQVIITANGGITAYYDDVRWYLAG